MAVKHYLKELVLLAVLVWGAFWLVTPYREYGKSRGALRQVGLDLLDQRMYNERLRQQIHRLKTDPRAIERVAREKFGYCRPNETVYDFSEAVGNYPPAPPPKQD